MSNSSWSAWSKALDNGEKAISNALRAAESGRNETATAYAKIAHAAALLAEAAK